MIYYLKVCSVVNIASGNVHCLHFESGRRGGLMVSALDFRASAPGSSPGGGHCVVFLGKRLKVPITPKYFFRLNKSLHLFETNCTF